MVRADIEVDDEEGDSRAMWCSGAMGMVVKMGPDRNVEDVADDAELGSEEEEEEEAEIVLGLVDE
jgi:hypothetical protein